jgi:hypothetical protein
MKPLLLSLIALMILAGCRREEQQQAYEAHTGYISPYDKMPGTEASPVTILVDTRNGMTWMLRTDRDGKPVWFSVDSTLINFDKKLAR